MGLAKDFKHCPECGKMIEKGLEVCPYCNSDIRAFQSKGGKEDQNHITLSLNPDERAALKEIKRVLDIRSDSTALKLAAFKGWDVLQRTLGKENLAWLCDKDRQSRGFK